MLISYILSIGSWHREEYNETEARSHKMSERRRVANLTFGSSSSSGVVVVSWRRVAVLLVDHLTPPVVHLLLVHRQLPVLDNSKTQHR